jgi:predicted GNAT family N-acyltransferase
VCWPKVTARSTVAAVADGAAPLRVAEADFERDYAAIRGIRFAVFVDEQQISPDLEMDDRDAHCVHLLARDERGEPVGTGRIDFATGAKVGRVAVLARARGRGVGTALMAEAQELARRRGAATVWCNAQVSAVPFYSKLGYRITSAPFYEAGIEHVRMELAL